MYTIDPSKCHLSSHTDPKVIGKYNFALLRRFSPLLRFAPLYLICDTMDFELGYPILHTILNPTVGESNRD